MDALHAHGVKTKILEINTDIDEEEYNNLKVVQTYGIYPFSFRRALEILKKDGKKIVYDTDDALDLIDPTNPFYYAVKRDSMSQTEVLHYADHVTVATPTLKKYLEGKTDKPITVIPNMYDPNEWKFPRPKREGIRIGFAGSCTHVEDLLLVLPTFKKLQKSHNITFVLMGFGRGTYDDWFRDFSFTCPPEGLKVLKEFDSLIKEINLEWIQNFDFDLFPSQLINLSLDIGLCPLVDNGFNRARSASKAMEYTLAGALALASNSPAYTEDPTSTIVEDWDKALTHFVENPQEIAQFRDINLRWIEENRNINNNIDLLKSVYVG